MNYYNDFETGNWLRELIKAGLIPDGEVDDRSITDIKPKDLNGFRQCHFFAGIAGWPRALDLAGWDSARPVWTASLPCQPLSVAGQQRGHEDERHLWPIFYNLVKVFRPPTIFGEQVASKDGREWLTGIFFDLEALGYAVAAADLPAASVGSPHKRNRLFWVANSKSQRFRKEGTSGPRQQEFKQSSSPTGRVADTERHGGRTDIQRRQAQGRDADGRHSFWSNSIAIPCADGKWRRVPGRVAESEPCRRQLQSSESRGNGAMEGKGKLRKSVGGDRNGYGVREDLLEIEPALFPLADGIPEGVDLSRVKILKGAGNAIVSQVAAEFVSAFMEIME